MACTSGMRVDPPTKTNATVTHTLHDESHGVPEVVHVQLLETRPRERTIVADAVKKRVDLDRCLGRRRQNLLRTFALHRETSERTMVATKVSASVRPHEILHARVDDPVVKNLTAKVGITSCRLHLEDPILDVGTGATTLPPPMS